MEKITKCKIEIDKHQFVYEIGKPAINNKIPSNITVSSEGVLILFEDMSSVTYNGYPYQLIRQ